MDDNEATIRERMDRYRWPSYLLGAALILCGITLAWAIAPEGGASVLSTDRDADDPVRTAAAAPGAAELHDLDDVDALVDRAREAAQLWDRVATYYDREIAPIERVLRQYRDDPGLANRVAVSLVREANAVGLEPRLLLAVLLVENPWLDPEIRSPVGAVGLMQVMPQHRGNWPPCEADLEDVEANICHGARIFAHYFRAEDGDAERALLRYNGCVRGTNTPDCHDYPYHVYARAGRASILAWLRPQAARAASP